MVLDELGLVPFLEVVAAVERAAERVVVVYGDALQGAVLDQPQVGLRRMCRERAIHLGLVKHGRRKHVACVRLVGLVPLE